MYVRADHDDRTSQYTTYSVRIHRRLSDEHVLKSSTRATDYYYGSRRVLSVNTTEAFPIINESFSVDCCLSSNKVGRKLTNVRAIVDLH